MCCAVCCAAAAAVQTTHDVACLSRWMAADLYLKEVDALRFELSMNHASDEVGVCGAWWSAEGGSGGDQSGLERCTC